MHQNDYYFFLACLKMNYRPAIPKIVFRGNPTIRPSTSAHAKVVQAENTSAGTSGFSIPGTSGNVALSPKPSLKGTVSTVKEHAQSPSSSIKPNKRQRTDNDSKYCGEDQKRNEEGKEVPHLAGTEPSRVQDAARLSDSDSDC